MHLMQYMYMSTRTVGQCNYFTTTVKMGTLCTKFCADISETTHLTILNIHSGSAFKDTLLNNTQRLSTP